MSKPDDMPNSDGFIPGTPWSKNHPDSTLKEREAKKEAAEHDKKTAAAAGTGTKSEKEHHGLVDKIKHIGHHDKTKEPKAET